MRSIRFYVGDQLRSFRVEVGDSILGSGRHKPAKSAAEREAGIGTKGRTPKGASAASSLAQWQKQFRSTIRALHDQAKRFADFMPVVSESTTVVSIPSKESTSSIIVAPALVLDGAAKSCVAEMRARHGFRLVREGSFGKWLLAAPSPDVQGVRAAAHAARDAVESGKAKAAHPNFVRILHRVTRAAAQAPAYWNHANHGNPGVASADVATLAAWTISRGAPEIRVAILDEGVDSRHPALRQAIVAQRDFVDGNATADPDGNDAHGTACAGIVVCRDGQRSGIADGCSLVAARIAKGDGNEGWVFDDFNTADAIDWCWSDAGADILSNSWGGGPPAPVITSAFLRARRNGRNKRGCVIAIATGNENGPVGYPATLPDVLAVGASNPWDERKSPSSKDGEHWWGSNYGREVSLLAPGVWISTTDIQGARGYNKSADYVSDFNGTSSATPHVAAAAALILSVRPDLNEAQVRKVLTDSADRLARDGSWDKYVGWGRLNVFSALRLARKL